MLKNQRIFQIYVNSSEVKYFLDEIETTIYDSRIFKVAIKNKKNLRNENGKSM